MPIELKPFTGQENQAILGICILAAFADGAQEEVERAQIERIVNGFAANRPELALVYQEVLSGGLTLALAASQLQSQPARALAYEMAVCVCNADGVLKDPETKFLADLRQALQLDPASVQPHEETARALAEPPVVSPAPPAIDTQREADIDRLVLNASIMNGALELMPHTLATMAILPLQMRMVYQVGKRYGYELDRGHITDFLATVGVGLTSQVFEGFARRLVGGLAHSLAGGLLGGLAGQATGSAFGFATTYALGQVAKRYYAGGRTLTAAQLKETFTSMLGEARSLQSRYSGDIAQKGRQVNVSELLPLVHQQ